MSIFSFLLIIYLSCYLSCNVYFRCFISDAIRLDNDFWGSLIYLVAIVGGVLHVGRRIVWLVESSPDQKQSSVQH